MTQTVENFSGRGKVYKDDDQISIVQYDIEIIHSNLLEITGQMTIVEGQKRLSELGILTLYLEDGKKWRFFANNDETNFEAINADTDKWLTQSDGS